jgi:hypothetical protein
MADDKIVTKKTAVKPAGTTKKAPVKTAAVATKKAPVKAEPATKKTAARGATPNRVAAAPAPAPAPRPIPKPPAASPAPRPEPTKSPTQPIARKAVTKKAAASPAIVPEAPPHPPLEEKPVSLQHLAQVTPEERLDMIREAAYYKAEARSFAPGNDAQDWEDAVREIDELLTKARQTYGS